MPCRFRSGVTIPSHLHFTVSDLSYDVILGLPWLQLGNKSADWIRRTIRFVHDGVLVALEAGKPSKRVLKSQYGDRLLNSVQVKRLLRKKKPFSKQC